MDMLPPLSVASAESSLNKARGNLRERLRAAAAHLLISATVAGIVIGLVYLLWYPTPLARIAGVGGILVMLLAVDVTLGPLMTLIVFDRRKKSLPWDLAVIGVVQLAALGYGLHTVEAGRPHYLVFAVDRFEVVSRADLRPEDLAAAAGLDAARADPLAPKLVGAEPFKDLARRRDMLLESVQGGRDLQHFPSQYRPIESLYVELAAYGKPLDALRSLNPGLENRLDQAIHATGADPAALRFLPLHGPAGDAAVLIDAATGKPLKMVDLEPWN